METSSITKLQEHGNNVVEKIPSGAINYFDRDSDGDTPLHLYVIKEGNTDDVIAFQFNSIYGNSPADWNIINNDGQTILLLAVVMKKPKTVKILLQKGARTDFTYENGNTICHVACKVGCDECLDELLMHINDVNILESKNSSNETPLHVAVRFGHLLCATSLLRREVSVNAIIPPNNKTSLILAIEKDNIEMVRLLLGAGADPNLQMMDGKTAAHVAVGKECQSIVQELEKNNADFTKKSFQNTTPIGCSPDAKRRKELTRHHNAKKTKLRRLEMKNSMAATQTSAPTTSTSYGSNTIRELLEIPQGILEQGRIVINPNQATELPNVEVSNSSIANTTTLGSLLGDVLMPDNEIRNNFLNYESQTVDPQHLLALLATKPVNEEDKALRHQMLDAYYGLI